MSGLKVTSPAAGEVWQRRSLQSVRWESVERSGNNTVTVILENNADVVALITANTPARYGKVSYRVPYSASPAESYCVVITDETGATARSGLFTIQ